MRDDRLQGILFDVPPTITLTGKPSKLQKLVIAWVPFFKSQPAPAVQSITQPYQPIFRTDLLPDKPVVCSTPLQRQSSGKTQLILR